MTLGTDVVVDGAPPPFPRSPARPKAIPSRPRPWAPSIRGPSTRSPIGRDGSVRSGKAGRRPATFARLAWVGFTHSRPRLKPGPSVIPKIRTGRADGHEHPVRTRSAAPCPSPWTSGRATSLCFPAHLLLRRLNHPTLAYWVSSLELEPLFDRGSGAQRTPRPIEVGHRPRSAA